MRGILWILLLVLALVTILAGQRLLGAYGFFPILALLAVPLPLVWLAFSRRAWRTHLDRPAAWIPAGLILLAALFFLPAAALGGGGQLAAVSWLHDLLSNLLFFIPSLALLVSLLLVRAAVLRWAVVQVEGAATRDHAAWASLILAALLLAKSLHSLYWILAWDKTTDPIDIFWLVVPVLAALYGGFILVATLPGRVRLAALAAPLVIALLFVPYALTRGLDIRQENARRAAEVVRLVESYQARTGAYPLALSSLAPFYTLSVPSPFILSGQTWCYEAGADYYRLGYVTRGHWSDPCLRAELVQSAGPLPDIPPLCAAQLAARADQIQTWCGQ
jgi:hypothetical protein